MAKLFRKSTFLFVFLGLLVLAKDHGAAANKHKDEIVAASAAGAASASGALAGLKGLGGKIGGPAAAGINAAVNASIEAAAAVSGDAGTGGQGCPCNDKVSEFLNKVLLILRYYTSKELGPELEGLAVRFVEFFFSHLAAEKPEAMARIHGFLQNSVQVTGAAVTKIAKA